MSLIFCKSALIFYILGTSDFPAFASGSELRTFLLPDRPRPAPTDPDRPRPALLHAQVRLATACRRTESGAYFLYSGIYFLYSGIYFLYKFIYFLYSDIYFLYDSIYFLYNSIYFLYFKVSVFLIFSINDKNDNKSCKTLSGYHEKHEPFFSPLETPLDPDQHGSVATQVPVVRK